MANTGPRQPARWETRSGAIMLGSLVGLGFAALVAALLVLLVPKDDEDPVAAEPDDTPTQESNEDETPTPAPVDFGGAWVTNFADMDLEQQGTSVTGQYFRFLDDNSPRDIKGVITDRTLDGTFDGDVNPIRFQLSDDGQSFFGHWADPQGGLHEWCGSRESLLPDGCGYSGEWRVKGFPPAADLDGDSIRMEQYGNTVRMRFDSGLHGEIELDLRFDGTTLAQASGEAQVGSGTIQFQFLVTEDPDWQTLRGTWVAPNNRGTWCAALEGSELPC